MAYPQENALVYMKQGSTELVIESSGILSMDGAMGVGSGGTIAVESGAEVNINSGAGLDVESGGDITVESGGKIVFPITGATSSASGSTTLTTLPADGLSFITSSGDTRLIYLTAPYKGAQKFIKLTAGSTGTVIYLDAKTAGAYFMDATGTNTTKGLLVWEGTTNGAAASIIHLVGYSTTKWMVVDMKSSTSFVFADTSS